ncbi:MAG: hypothetical protein AAB375_00795 [Patescibacteria group bacterium]
MIAKYGTLFYALLALILLVSKVALHDANLMVSALLWTGVFALLLHIPGVRPLAVCIAGSGAFVLGMIITSMVAGDWEVTHRIASTCVLTPWGDLHSHHGLKGALVVAIHLAVFLAIRRASEEARPGVIRLCGRRIGRAATWLIIAAVLMAPFVVREGQRYGATQSMFSDTLCYGLYLFLLGAVCREGHIGRLWFKTFFATSFGMALAVFVSAGFEFTREMVNGGKTPATLILWHAEGDPACHP